MSTKDDGQIYDDPRTKKRIRVSQGRIIQFWWDSSLSMYEWPEGKEEWGSYPPPPTDVS